MRLLRKIAIIALACTAGIFQPGAALPGTYTYRIGLVKEMLASRDPGGSVYYLQIQSVGDNGPARVTCTLVSRSKLVAFLKEHKLNTPEQLMGLQFQDAFSDPLAAVKSQFETSAKNAHYPELYQRASEALARLEFPTFPGTDADTVYDAFSAAFWDRAWFENLSTEIEKSSHVKILRDQTPPRQVAGPAKYFILTDGNRAIRMAFTPSSTPFTSTLEETSPNQSLQAIPAPEPVAGP